MPRTRRLARELALRAIFQVDVGKQPLSDAMEGAMDLLRTMIHEPILQIARRSQAEIRQVSRDKTEDLSPQSGRTLRSFATNAGSEVSRVADKAMEEANRIIASTTLVDSGRSLLNIANARISAQQSLNRIKQRETLHPELLAEFVDMALKAVGQIEAAYIRHLPAALEISQFVSELAKGTTQRLVEIDEKLSLLASGWTIERQAAVDRNIMRLAAYEILYQPKIPIGATINEAVELAKKYSTAESGRFVNGVLGTLATQNPKHNAIEPEIAEGSEAEELQLPEVWEE